MTTTAATQTATTYCATIGRQLVSEVVMDTTWGVAFFATARTVEGNLGSYTTHAVHEMDLETGYVRTVDGCEDGTRDAALAVIASFAARIAA